jgi:hypothetical protein
MQRGDYVSALCAVFAASITPEIRKISDGVPVVHFIAAVFAEAGEGTVFVKALILLVYYVVSVFGFPVVRRWTPVVFFVADLSYVIWHVSAHERLSVGGVVPLVISGVSCGVHGYFYFQSWTLRSKMIKTKGPQM